MSDSDYSVSEDESGWSCSSSSGLFSILKLLGQVDI